MSDETHTTEDLEELQRIENILRHLYLWQAFAEDYGLLSISIQGEEVWYHDVEMWLSWLEESHREAVYNVFILDLSPRDTNRSNYRYLAEEALTIILNNRIERRASGCGNTQEWD